MSSQSPATLMNLPGLWQLKAEVYFVKSGLMMSLQSPWDVQDSVEIGILKDSMQCYVPSLLWQQRPQQFPWLILSLAPPGCSGAGDSFCGLLLCHQRWGGTSGEQIKSSFAEHQACTQVLPGLCNSPASFLCAQGLYFSLFERPEKLI